MPWNDRLKRRLKLRDLDILMAVIDAGSMGKAAHRLNISQPAVSKAIVELEEALGVQLMDRSRRGVVPTPYAHALGRRSAAIFNDLRQSVEDIDFLSDPTKGELRIGTTEPVATAIVLPAIDQLSRKFPQMVFHIVAGDAAMLYRAVADRNIEFAVCRMTGQLPDDLAAEPLLYDALSVVTAAHNPLTRRRKLALKDLANEPWTHYPPDSHFGSIVAEGFRAAGMEPPRLTVSSLSFYVHSELLATGRFLTVLPSFMLKIPGRQPPLKALPVTLPDTRKPVGIIAPKNRTLTPLAELVIENVRAFAKPLARS